MGYGCCNADRHMQGSCERVWVLSTVCCSSCICKCVYQHVEVVCVVVGNKLIRSCNPAKHKVKMALHW